MTLETPSVGTLGDLACAMLADIAEAHGAFIDKRPRGPMTGLPTLDKELGGAFEPGLHFLHGSPSSGKTALALQIAAECGCPAIYISTEMRLIELGYRMVARLTGTALTRLKSGEIDPSETMGKVQAAASAVPHLVLVDAQRECKSKDGIAALAEKVRANIAEQAQESTTDDPSPHLLIVVDSIHTWAGLGSYAGDEYGALGAAISDLQQLARALNCAVLGISERNRASMKEGGQSASAGTRKFEYQAESIISLDNSTNGGQGRVSAGEEPRTLKLEKNRNGAMGRSIAVQFNGGLQRFKE